MMELDHLFCFCPSPAAEEVAIAERAGFTLNKGTSHRGQGTANRCILFRENYLELIFLDSRDDALGNELRLDRRADWRESGSSPFGICLRGDPAERRAEFREYRPPYWPQGAILIHESAFAHPEWPLLFAVPGSLPPSERKGVPPELLVHGSRSGRIRSAIVEGPLYEELAFPLPASLSLRNGEKPSMRVALDGQFPSVELNELLSLRP